MQKSGSEPDRTRAHPNIFMRPELYLWLSMNVKLILDKKMALERVFQRFPCAVRPRNWAFIVRLASLPTPPSLLQGSFCLALYALSLLGKFYWHQRELYPA